MALAQSPKIVTDSLIFYYDMNNGKSFVGGPVTNTLPTPAVNGLPTYGNGWGTYNTNQYGSGAFFSIGSVASVSGNIVTMTAAHSLRSYDVMRPQTTGGGVTANTDYLIKKLSNTTFSLHPYNGSQDGSQGYINPATGNHKVYDDFANDVRISINATSFPTMWWGAPHLPNSALVKEIIPQGFTGISGRPPTDCIRLHHNRTDATDGMAYGPDAAVVAGTPYTVSFWARSVTASAVGTTGSYQIYNYGSTTPSGHSVGYTLGPVGEWRKYTLTFTPNNPLAISYWFPGSGGIKYDIANIQFEAGSVANNFTPGTRSNTQVVLDLTSNNNITANSVVYASDGTFSFSNGYMSLPSLNLQRNFTLECWVRLTSVGTAVGLFGQGPTALNQGLHIGWFPGRGLLFGMYGNDLEGPAYSMTYNAWHHFVFTYDHGTYFKQTWADGVLVSSGALNQYSGSGQFNIGSIYSSPIYTSFTGNFAIARAYSKVLSAAEIKQNFNAQRSRYGL
jgi:hypothetical protein